jgi:hypothetical protein
MFMFKTYVLYTLMYCQVSLKVQTHMWLYLMRSELDTRWLSLYNNLQQWKLKQPVERSSRVCTSVPPKWLSQCKALIHIRNQHPNCPPVGWLFWTPIHPLPLLPEEDTQTSHTWGPTSQNGGACRLPDGEPYICNNGRGRCNWVVWYR